MDAWGAPLYGEPCRECGFSFTLDLDAAVSLIADLPDSYAALLSGASGAERFPGLGWSAGAYVCHVADNLRIWAERLAGTEGGSVPIGAYDENLLAEARGYEHIPLAASLWSLRRSVAEWLEVVARYRTSPVILVHPERGELTLHDFALANAHDSFHHRWDIGRSLGVTGS
jgi:hypothetical protein